MISILGKNIKKIRTSRNITQKELSVLSNVSQSTIAEIEKGTRQNLRADNLNKISIALAISTDELLGLSKDTEYTMPNISSLGKNIRKIRIEKKLGLNELSRLSGVSRSSISMLETGKIQSLSNNNLIKIADVLNVSGDSLLGLSHTSKSDSIELSDFFDAILKTSDLRLKSIPLSYSELKELEIELKFVTEKLLLKREQSLL